MKYEVIDNFLDEKYFDSLVTLFTDKEKTGNMPWFFQSSIVYKNVVEGKLFCMTHRLYENNVPISTHYNKMIPLLEKLNAYCLIRIKQDGGKY